MVGMEYFSSLDSGIHILSFLSSFFYSAMKKQWLSLLLFQ